MPLRSQTVDPAMNFFSLEKVIPGFLQIAKEQNIGKGITKSSSSFVRDNESHYEDLKVSISFGQGRATAVPWIAFTGYKQTLQNGIYPVYLYYKSRNKLILAYGLSDTNLPQDHWPNKGGLETVETYFKQRGEPAPERYGSSIVHSVYDTSQSLDFVKMENDLKQLINEFHALFTSSANQVNEFAQPYLRSKRVKAKQDNLVVGRIRDDKANERYEDYGMDKALKELFIDRTKISSILGALNHKKNIILQGPPGTGKTYLAKRIAYLKLGQKNPTRVEVIQFHQSYAYEDFIQGYRPNGQGQFDLKNGPFYEFCLRAQRDPENDYFFIIDEINRGNLSKIFGELLMLMENDKRGPEFAIQLTYSKDDSSKFYMPANLHLIGTMNTADRSLAMVDYALRRRFAFVTISPEFGSSFIQYLISKKAPEKLAKKISDNIKELNRVINQDRNLGEGFAIGHSYFCNSPSDYDEDWYKRVIEHEIAPLLYAYWFDAEDKADEHIHNLLD